MDYYHIKDKDYFSGVRMELVNLLPKNSDRVLEVGAGGCNTLFYLKENKIAKEVHGIDIFSLPQSFQNHPLIDKFFLQNIEAPDFDLSENYYDSIICGDVLEHLVDPWAAVKKIERWLKPGGTLIVSIPNFREIGTLKKIIFNKDFKYAEEGILDKTHLRFFCKKNILALLTTDQLKPELCLENFLVHPGYKKRKLANTFTLGLLKDLLTGQYYVVCKKQINPVVARG